MSGLENEKKGFLKDTEEPATTLSGLRIGPWFKSIDQDLMIRERKDVPER